MSIECVLTDPLFYGVAAAGVILGASLAVIFILVAAGNKAVNDASPPTRSPPPVIFCTKEDINDPDFVERMYRAQGGNDGA